MTEKCCACRKEFKDGEEVVTFYFERTKIGEKSGLVGFYAHPNYPDDSIERVHFTHQCLEKCFSPMDNPFLYDSIVHKIRSEVEEDLRQEIYDEISIEFDEDIVIPDVDDPPYCLWCKRRDSVWIQIRNQGYFYACTACNKYWDQDENELTQSGQAA